MKSKRRMKSPTHSGSRDCDYEESFDLPEEIILEILLRVPVKSILKFRCVSKAWLSLISSQRFIQTHYKVSTESSNLNGHKAIFATCYPPSHLMQCSVQSLLCDQPLTAALNFGNLTRQSQRYVWMVGSCNGLICISMNLNDLFLWNPSIRKSKKLPSMAREHYIIMCLAYGFGFDEAHDDYKVVGVFCGIERGGGTKKIVMVYSLRIDSWKMVGKLKGGVPWLKSIVFASGKAHWLAKCKRGPNYTWYIVSLDLESGKYGAVGQLDCEKDNVNCTLGLLGGCLGVVRYDLKAHVDVWVLKEYGVKGSWRKLFHFSCIDLTSRFVFYRPLCLLPNGEILLVCGRRFIVCNPRYDSFKVVEAANLGTFFEVDVLIESLVSPDVK